MDAVQGSQEEQVSCMEGYGERATDAADPPKADQEPAGTAGSAGRPGKAVRGAGY